MRLTSLAGPPDKTLERRFRTQADNANGETAASAERPVMRLSGRVSWGLPPITAGSPATMLPGPVNGSMPVCCSPLVKGMRVRQNGHRASNWTPWPGRSRGRDVRQADRGMPRAVSGRFLLPVPAGRRGWCAGKGGLSLRPPRRRGRHPRRLVLTTWLRCLSRHRGQTPPLAQPGLARGRSAWTSQHAK